MKLWLLTRLNDIGWDEHCGFVIRAETELQARAIANIKPADEGAIWHDKSKVACVQLTEDGPEGIVLDSFNAG